MVINSTFQLVWQDSELQNWSGQNIEASRGERGKVSSAREQRRRATGFCEKQAMWSLGVTWKTSFRGLPHLTCNSITLDNYLILLMLSFLFCLSGINIPCCRLLSGSQMISNVKYFGNCKALSTLGGNIIIRDLGVGKSCPSCAFPLPHSYHEISLLPPNLQRPHLSVINIRSKLPPWPPFKRYHLHFPVGILSSLSPDCRNAWSTTSLSWMEKSLRWNTPVAGKERDCESSKHCWGRQHDIWGSE